MSTRALYSFVDEYATPTVYKHCDGSPSGAAEAIKAAIDFAWPLPRFEADDFGAAFVAANKQSATERMNEMAKGSPDLKPEHMRRACGGDVYLCGTGDWRTAGHWDCVYRYEVSCVDGKLRVKAWAVRHVDDDRDPDGGEWKETEIHDGDLAKLAKTKG